jgi:D-tyrosyl-tRNA(Tyr) deacylase
MERRMKKKTAKQTKAAFACVEYILEIEWIDIEEVVGSYESAEEAIKEMKESSIYYSAMLAYGGEAYADQLIKDTWNDLAEKTVSITKIETIVTTTNGN